MLKPTRLACIAVILNLSFIASSQASNTMQALVGLHKPPYIDLTNNSGYEIELLQLIAEEMNYNINFTHVPNRRIGATLSSAAFDLATLQRAESSNANYFYTCPYIQYQNMIVTRSADELPMSTVSDLWGLTVVGFQTATIALGEEFKDATDQAESYIETVNQRSQVAMLLTNRVDAIVLDNNILNHYLMSYESPPSLSRFTVGTTYYRIAFKDFELAQQFDIAQQRVWQTESYQQLQMKYFGTINQDLEPVCDEY